MKIKSLKKFFDNLKSNLNPKYLPLPKNSLTKNLKLSGLSFNYLVEHAQFETVLDVGSGSGRHADLFQKFGKKVFRFDYGKSKAFTDQSNVIIGDFLKYKFKRKFDLVWASHVLEHTIHTQEFLEKTLNITKKNGMVAITVPPAKSEFVGGHVTLWTPAILLYRLVLAGFDCSEAKVFVYGYNISVIVKARRNSLDVNTLAWDFNDIARLSKWFPKGLKPNIDGAKFGKVFRGAEINLK